MQSIHASDLKKNASIVIPPSIYDSLGSFLLALSCGMGSLVESRAMVKKKIKAVLFDFNGVIIDDEGVHLDLFVEVLAPHGIVVDRDLYWKEFLGMDDRGALSGLWGKGKGTVPDESLLDALIRQKAVLYMKRLEKGLPLYHGAASLIRDLSSRYPMGVVSGALRPEIEGTLSRAGLSDCFLFIVSAEDTVSGKPDPEGYLKGLALLRTSGNLFSVSPEEILVIEDSVQGVEAAKSAGLTAFAVCHTYSPESFDKADRVFRTIGDVSTPDIDSFEGQ